MGEIQGYLVVCEYMVSLVFVFCVNVMIFCCKMFFVSLVGLFWVGGLFVVYWWFEICYICLFSEQIILFFGDSLCLLVELVGLGVICLVYFWDLVCFCNVGNQQYFGELIECFVGKGVEFYVLQKFGSQGCLLDNLVVLCVFVGLFGFEQLLVSLVVVIWDCDGCLVYFGFYSEGVVCIFSNSFIELIFEVLLQGCLVDVIYIFVVGCYCFWILEKG